MRLAFLGTILFSITARSQSDAASTQAVCVDDCIKSLAEHGLLTNGMKSICAAPQLQKAHFQCLINACSADSYGSAVKQSISVCSANGANIIPLHPIEVRQPQSSKHGQSQMGGQASEHLSMVKNQKLHLPRNVAMDLTCNTAGDGLVTVSLGPPLPSATPSIFEKEDVRKQSPRATPISSHEGIVFVKDAKALMEEFQDASTLTTTTSCDSSTYKMNAESTVSSTLSQTTACSSAESQIEDMLTSTILSNFDRKTRSSETSTMSSMSKLDESSTQTSSCPESSLMTSSHVTSSSYMEARTSEPSASSPTSECPESMTESVVALSATSSTRVSSSSSSTSQAKSTSKSKSTSSASAVTSSTGCSSFSSYSNEMARQTSTTSSSSTGSSSLPASSCNDERTSSSSFLTKTATTTSSSTKPCSSSSRASTYSAQLNTGCSSSSRASSSYKILNTPSTTSSTTHASTTTSESVTKASPAAYTLITPSLPPSYVVPDLEEYGYGNPPPAYGFSKAASDVPSSTASRSVTSSRFSITSSARLSRTTSEPAVYGSSTSMTTMTQMTRLASLQVDSDPSDDSVENADVVKVTLISSIAGEYHTTVVTIQQAGAAASTDAPSRLALSDASNEGSSEDESSFAHPNAVSGEGTAFSAETPMPAVFVAAGVNSRPNELAMILAGFVVSIFYWAL